MKRYSTARFTVALFMLAFCSGNAHAALSHSAVRLDRTQLEAAARRQNCVLAESIEERHNSPARGPNFGMPQSVD